MARDISRSIWIRRTPDEVAAYVFDPVHDPEWLSRVVGTRPDQPGVLETGHTFERTSRILGFTLENNFVVTSHRAGSFVEMKTESPFPTVVRYTLRPEGDGTTLEVHTAGAPGRFFGRAAPVAAWWAGRIIAGDLTRLKAILEG